MRRDHEQAVHRAGHLSRRSTVYGSIRCDECPRFIEAMATHPLDLAYHLERKRHELCRGPGQCPYHERPDESDVDTAEQRAVTVKPK